ncbi:ABC transporter ATP-binding protein [Lachnospira eligens]|uniref:ABC transporter ATP-binding protein n=1 Tax=Lachnospira eligens TaxID=39485 RepID=A0A414DCL4_9FIRM|nr:ABC transporter ATP-binding protein [Lachnospira eligens]RHD08240.1 ABC transporter ATP-binding protein [Lachnospira eligens]
MKDTRRFLQYIGKYRFRYWLILIITLITESALQVLYSYVTRQIINAVEFQNMQMFRTAVIVCVIIVICKCLFPYLRYFHIHLVRRMVYDLKLRLFEKLLDMNMKFYDDTHSAEAMRTLNMDADSLKTAWFSHVYWVSGKLVLVISSVVTMFFYSPILTFIALIISVLTAFVSIRINNSIKKHAKNVQNKSARLATLFSDIISGFVTLKMNSGASIVLKHFYKENGESAQAERSRVRMEASLEMAAFLLGIIGSFGTIIVGALLVADGKLNFGIVMAVVTLQMSMSSAMQRFGSSLAVFTTSVVRAGHVFDFLELEQEECVGWNTQTQVGTEDLHDKCDVVIEFYKLHFSYNENTQLYYEGLKVKNGEKIMLAGESGCGKSTFLKLLQRFYPVESGSVRLYGRELNEYSLMQLRNMITYVPQESYLFEGTIRENIEYGWNKAGSPDMDMIVRAAKQAYADEFISELPDGYDTRLTAGGMNLSGGQRQRIAIARAMLKDSPVILMDEPSSALDTHSENVFLKVLDSLMKDKTVIMVSHRMTGVERFDRVVRL